MRSILPRGGLLFRIAGMLIISIFLYAPCCLAAEVRVNVGRKTGSIRAIHGINGGPVCYGGVIDVSAYHRALGVPLTRIHDANWPARNVVDIHAIFPNFSADAEQAANYCFAPTDDYLKSILAVGSGVMYRLGESIEHTPRKYYVHKPADFDQWAKICLGIIRHYNEGWADGFHFNLRYFEIWNEAEIGAPQWDGSSDDYYRLYATAAKAIKARYPKLRVGGPAAAGLGSLDGDRLTPAPHLRGFLEYCRRESLPLDFLSWHMYSADPTAPVRGAIGLRRVLDAHGFRKAEIHLNEWNYLPNDDWSGVFGHDGQRMQKSFEEAGGPRGAAFAACVLLGLQDVPLDMSNFYTGDNGCWGLFNVFGVPKKTYHAFRAFKALVDHPVRVAVESGKPGEWNAVAGLSKDGRELALVVSSFKSADQRIEITLRNLPWSGPSATELLLLDQTRNLERIQTAAHAAGNVKIVQELPAPGVLLVNVRPR
jgi:xylan 1,4-beta-xylosidase